MADIPDNKPQNKEPAEGSRETVEASLRYAEQHKSGKRGRAPDMPEPNPDDAASGRLAPDPLEAAEPRDPLKTGPTDVNRGA
jgi:hypothetical protein